MITLFNVVAGEAMEKGLRDCCRSIRIGKILIQSEPGSSKPQVGGLSGCTINRVLSCILTVLHKSKS